MIGHAVIFLFAVKIVEALQDIVVDAHGIVGGFVIGLIAVGDGPHQRVIGPMVGGKKVGVMDGPQRLTGFDDGLHMAVEP